MGETPFYGRTKRASPVTLQALVIIILVVPQCTTGLEELHSSKSL